MNKQTKKKMLLQYFTDSLITEMSEIPYINYGGCGIMAAHIHKALTELGFESKILCLTPDTESIKEYFEGNNSPYDVWFHHLVVKVGRIYIDAEYKYNTLDEIVECDTASTKKNIEVPLDAVEDWNSCKSMWNYKFERRKYEKHIERIMENIILDCKAKLI